MSSATVPPRATAAQFDLLIVGASFAGLACARAAARTGLRVLVVDKKARAGDKLHTTGIIVKDAVDTVPWLAEVPRAMVRRIEGVRLYAPDMRHVDLQAPGYYFLATDTPALLDWMVDSVRECGVQVMHEALFVSAARVGDAWEVPLGTERVRAHYLVGADGPHSRVAKALGLSLNSHFLYGLEHEYEKADLEPDFLHCFVDRRLAPGYIGWALQGVGMSQIGLAWRTRPMESMGQDTPALRLDGLLDKVASVARPLGAGPAAVRAGMIPCGGLLPVVAREGALLVGDAAGMVSPVTAGGIHLALRHGEAAGQAVSAFLRGKRPDPAAWFVKTYPGLRSKRMLRWCFDHFQSDWLFNQLLSTHTMRRIAGQIYFHRKASESGHDFFQDRVGSNLG